MNEESNQEIENANPQSSNANQLFDLIQNIQSKLNSENHSDSMVNHETTENQNKDETILENEEKQTEQTHTKVDFSSILKNIDLNSLLNTFGNMNTNKTDETNVNETSSFNLGGMDPSLLLKFGNLFSSATRSDPKRNLLLSLKPFLRKTRQDKLNEYVTILTIVDAIGIFNSKGSDHNV